MTSLLQKIIELDLRIDNISTSGGGGTTDTTALQNQIDINTDDILTLQTDKQDKLTAGDNITIVGNTISSSGGGGTSTSAFWSRGGTINGVVVNTPYEQVNIPFTVIQTPEVNCVYDTTNNTITIQQSGKYLITYGAMSASNNSTINVFLRKNNLTRFKAYSGGDSGFRQVHGSMILDLVVGDFVSIYKESGPMFGSEEYRYFNGYLIG
jgi:hypothetical protein